jgi:hypothetical protein
VLWTHASLAACLSLFLWSTAHLEARPGPCGSAGAHLDREARSGAEEHMAASELFSQGDSARSHGTRGSDRAHIGRKARSGVEEHVATPELNSARRRDPGPRDSTGAHISKEVRSRATGHVPAPEPTSAGRCGPELLLAWQRLDARTASFHDLKLVCRGTR